MNKAAKVAKVRALLEELELEMSLVVDGDDGSTLLKSTHLVLLEINLQVFWALIVLEPGEIPKVKMAGWPPEDCELEQPNDFLRGGSSQEAIRTVQRWLDRGNMPNCLKEISSVAA
jgi:hypothetical protein